MLFHCIQYGDILHWPFTALTVLSPGWAPPDVPSPSGASAPSRPSERAALIASLPHCLMTGKRERSWRKVSFKKKLRFHAKSHLSTYTRFGPALPLLKRFFLSSLMFSSWANSHDGLWAQHFQSEPSDFASAPLKQSPPFTTETDVIILPPSYGHEIFICMCNPGPYIEHMRT